MKVFGWILIVIWGLTTISLTGELFQGIDAEINTMAVALGIAQIIFNYKAINKEK